MLRPTLALTLLAAPLALGAQAPFATDTTPRINVNVTRSARVIPDRVSFYVTIEGSAETPADAVRRVQQKLEAVLAAVGPRVESHTVLPYGVVPAPNTGGFPQQAAVLPFVARYAVKLTPRRVGDMQELASSAIGAGALGTAGLQYEFSSPDSVRRELIASAIRQGEREADAVAASLGGRRGALVSVSVGSAPTFGPQSSTLSFSTRFDMGGQVQSPESQVTSNVNLTYRLLR